MLKVLVCGGRDFDDYIKMRTYLNRNLPDSPVTIISGMARGADSLAVRYAEEMGDEVEEFHANWEKFGRKAGPIRNQQMLDEGKPDQVIAFSGGRGTAHMVSIAKKAGVPVQEIE